VLTAGLPEMVASAWAADEDLSGVNRETIEAVVTALGRAGVSPFGTAEAARISGDAAEHSAQGPGDPRDTVGSALNILRKSGKPAFGDRGDVGRYRYLRRTLGSPKDMVSARDGRGHSFDQHLAYEADRIGRVAARLPASDRQGLELDPDEGYLQTFEVAPVRSHWIEAPVHPTADTAAGKRRLAAVTAVEVAAAPLQPKFELPQPPSPVNL
jgi:hypothetical protein